MVAKLRGTLKRRTGDRKLKVGHAGTLDPLASGLLIVCVGRATKVRRPQEALLRKRPQETSALTDPHAINNLKKIYLVYI